MPVMSGLCIPGKSIVSINSAEVLEDFFVKHGSYLTKDPILKTCVHFLCGGSILAMDT